MAKLSKKQREERRQTIKLLAGVGVGVAILGAGGLVVSNMGPASALEGPTLDERLVQAGLKDYALRLVGDEGPADVVVIGSSDCGFCRSFVAEGLDEFVETATALNLRVDYLALAGGLGSLSSTMALDCLKAMGSQPKAILRATYAVSERVRDEGLAQPEFTQVIENQARLMGGDIDAAGCMVTELTPAARSQIISDVFELRGTPSFYVESAADSSDIRLFSGFSNSSATSRQLRKNREE